MAYDKGKISDLLGTGLSIEKVAGAVGCDPSYISHLMADPIFANEVVEKRTVSLLAASERDKNIDDIEDKLLTKLADLVDEGLIYKPAEVLRAAAVVNNMKRRGVAAHENTSVAATIINLSMPTAIVNNFIANTQGEVIKAGDQTLVTMPAQQLLKTLATSGNYDAQDRAKYEQVGRFIPAPLPAITVGNGNGNGSK